VAGYKSAGKHRERLNRPSVAVVNIMWTLGVAMLCLSCFLAISMRSAHDSPHSRPRAGLAADSPGPPALGILGFSGDDIVAEKQAGITSVTISISWRHAEPQENQWSADYLSSMNSRILLAKDSGFSVTVDPGLQYSPSWLFSLPGGTRFVDQYGQPYGGEPQTGDDVANAVTDPAVRAGEIVKTCG
jgi:hypothetical protein